MQPEDGGAGGPAGHAPATQTTDRWAAMRARTVPAIGLLPLRVFLGVTYLYAGIDKFTNPHFFVAGDPFSVAAQMEGYTRMSPLAPLITAAMPMATGIGFLIALGELAVGLGVLTGLSYRLAAMGGFLLSMLFWLTASWSSTPYFFSPDLPYAMGFLTLALVGHGGVLVLKRVQSQASGAPVADAAARGPGPSSPARRTVLQMGLLTGLSLAAAAIASSWRLFGSVAANAGTGAAATASPAPVSPTAAPATPGATASPGAAATNASTAAPATPAPTAPPTAAPTAAPTAVAGDGPVIGNVTDLAARNGIPFTVPFEAPTALNPGGSGIMVRLPDGRVVAYSSICTHGRCTVALDPTTGVLLCPCHLGTFDPANQAAVLSGPPPGPLSSIPLSVDGAGQIHVVITG